VAEPARSRPERAKPLSDSVMQLWRHAGNHLSLWHVRGLELRCFAAPLAPEPRLEHAKDLEELACEACRCNSGGGFFVLREPSSGASLEAASSCSPDSRRRTPNRAPHSAAGPFLCLRCLVRHQNLVRRQHRCGGTQYGRHCRPNRLKLLHLSNFGRRVQESPSIWSPECTVQRSPNQQLVTSEGLWAQLLILVWPP
jgi:hypothetical protein